jgi:hypothetical protein
MGRPKQPISLVVANGRKHLSKSEIAERMAQEVPAPAGEMTVPAGLTGKRETELYSNCVRWLKESGLESPAYSYACMRWAQSQCLCERRYKDLKRADSGKLEGMSMELISQIETLYDRACRMALMLESKLGMTPADKAKIMRPAALQGAQRKKQSKFDALMDAPWLNS